MTLGRQLKRRFAVPYGCYKLVTGRHSFLHQSGWFESVRTSKPCSAGGDPVPWMNYSVVEFLSERLSKSMTVFEYGSGCSTCFFAERTRQVVSIEYDRVWYDQVVSMIPENARVIFQPFDESGSYAKTICQQEQVFDVVVVDGQDRVNCVNLSLTKLSSRGVIVLDDSDRDYYRPGFERLEREGFRHLSIAGIKPGSSCRHESTVFYRDGNCFGV